MMKHCKRCQITKPLSEFSRTRKSNVAWCKACHNAYNAKWYRENKERLREYHIAWYKTNHKEQLKKQATWWAANLDRKRETSRKWNAANPEKKRDYDNRRRAREAAAPTFVVSLKDSRRLSTAPCYICGADMDHIDHIIPLSKGGRHSIGNLAPACEHCNLSKGDRFLIQVKAKLLRRVA